MLLVTRQNEQGGDEGEGDEGHPEAGGVHDPAVTSLVHQEDEQPQKKGQHKGQSGVQQETLSSRSRKLDLKMS